MSSKVKRRDRLQRKPRKVMSDFSPTEQKVLRVLSDHFGSPVVVFGSRAKGNYADDSDLDVGISNFHPRKHKAIIDNVSGVYGIKIDAHVFKNALTHNGAIEL